MSDNSNTGRRKSGSDRERIRNITDQVHPERENGNRKKKKSTASGRQRPMTSEDIELRRQRRKIVEHRRKLRRKQRMHRIFTILVSGIVVAAIVVTIVIVRGFTTGSGHDSKGLEAYDSGDYETAAEEFKKAITYDDNNADYYIHLGMAYIDESSSTDAVNTLNQALQYASGDRQSALAYRGIGIADFVSGDYEGAADAFDSALALDISDEDLKLDILYYKAKAQVRADDYSGAADTYSQIIEIDDTSNARMLRADVYKHQHDYENEETDLRKALDLSGNSYLIYMDLYDALADQGKDDEAKQVLNEALEIGGDGKEDLFNRGMIEIHLGDYDAAADDLNQSLDKGYDEALLGLGKCAAASGDYGTAIADYEKYINETGVSKSDTRLAAVTYELYASSLIGAGRYEDALQACQNGLAVGDSTTEAALTFDMAVTNEYLGNWEDAYNIMKSYVEEYPDDDKGMKEYTFLESRL